MTAVTKRTEKDLEMKFSFSRGWYQNKTNDAGLLGRQGRNKTCAIHHGLFLQSKRKPAAPRSMSHATSHPGTQSMPRGTLLGLLTARSERLALKPPREHSKFNREIPRHKELLPPLFHCPEQAPVCCSSVQPT